MFEDLTQRRKCPNRAVSIHHWSPGVVVRAEVVKHGRVCILDKDSLVLNRFLLAAVIILLGHSQARAETFPTANVCSSEEVISWTRKYLKNIERVDEYECRLWRRERLDGELRKPTSIRLKMRHRPRCMHASFLVLAGLKAHDHPQLLFAEGRQESRITLDSGNCFRSIRRIRPSEWRPAGDPPTQWDIQNVTKRFLSKLQDNKDIPGWKSRTIKSTTINKRSCTLLEIVHPSREDEIKHHVVRIYVDDEVQIPVRLAAWKRPSQDGAKPELAEEHTYVDINLEPGFQDSDFDERNPNYSFIELLEPQNPSPTQESLAPEDPRIEDIQYRQSPSPRRRCRFRR